MDCRTESDIDSISRIAWPESYLIGNCNTVSFQFQIWCTCVISRQTIDHPFSMALNKASDLRTLRELRQNKHGYGCYLIVPAYARFFYQARKTKFLAFSRSICWWHSVNITSHQRWIKILLRVRLIVAQIHSIKT